MTIPEFVQELKELQVTWSREREPLRTQDGLDPIQALARKKFNKQYSTYDAGEALGLDWRNAMAIQRVSENLQGRDEKLEKDILDATINRQQASELPEFREHTD